MFKTACKCLLIVNYDLTVHIAANKNESKETSALYFFMVLHVLCTIMGLENVGELFARFPYLF